MLGKNMMPCVTYLQEFLMSTLRFAKSRMKDKEIAKHPVGKEVKLEEQVGTGLGPGLPCLSRPTDRALDLQMTSIRTMQDIYED
jgi:hypothetical protein